MSSADTQFINATGNSEQIRLDPIAIVRSPYKQKFAIPRQANLVEQAVGEILFKEEFSDVNALRGLEQFSHLWLIFLFHETAAQGWSPTVQPPRLGGKERVGVFASRSPFRPNAIGMSAVRNLGYDSDEGLLRLKVGGIDLLDGTPLIDIKPYLPYADAIVDASGGFAAGAPQADMEIRFSEAARDQLAELENEYEALGEFIASVLRQDPRPAWRVKADDDKQYGMTLYDLNIKWRVEDKGISVLTIQKSVDA